MLYLIILLLIAAIIAIVANSMQKGDDGNSDKPAPISCSTCDGENQKCEQECMMEAATKPIEYFDDEELDAFKGRPADSYSEEETEVFRDILFSMQQQEVAEWNRSLLLRGINVPLQLRDELIMLLSDN